MMNNWIRSFLGFSGCMLLLSVQDVTIAPPIIQENGNTRVSIAAETTRITEPLDDAGYVDFLEALNRSHLAEVDADDNFALVLWRVLDLDIVPPADREAFFDRLSFNRDSGSALPALVDSETFFATYGFESGRDRMKARTFLDGPLVPWRSSDSPAVEALLTQNREPLDFLIKGMERSGFAQPYVHDAPPKIISSQLYGILEMKEIARMFATRAMLHQGNNELDQALEDVFACHRIGCFLIRRATAIEVINGFEVCRWATEAERSIASAESLDRIQVRAHLDKLVRNPPTRDLGDVFGRASRWCVLEIAQLNARYAGEPDAPPSVSIPVEAKFASIDFDVSMRIINDWYDRGVKALGGETHHVVLSEIEKIYRDLEVLDGNLKKEPETSADSLGRSLGAIWVTSLYPDLKGLYLSSVRARTDFRLVVTAYASRLYEIDKNRFPDTLDELAGEFVTDKNLYLDPSTGQPFQLEKKRQQLEISAATTTGKRRIVTIPKSQR